MPEGHITASLKKGKAGACVKETLTLEGRPSLRATGAKQDDEAQA
jgi:hypothetical protein